MTAARQTLWSAVLVVAFIAAGVLVLRWSDREVPADAAAVPPGAQPVTIRYARDGDTLYAAAREVGPVVDTTADVQLRLIGIDAPETGGCYAREAYQELRRMAPSGTDLWLVGDHERLDPYHRFLVYAWTTDGRFVNGELARLGFVRALPIPPNTAYADQLGAAVAEARAARRGLWGAC